jgi:hypothetical protein
MSSDGDDDETGYGKPPNHTRGKAKAAIQIINARLACYDKISPPIAASKSATSKTPPTSGPERFVDLLGAENARTDAAMKNICRGC